MGDKESQYKNSLDMIQSCGSKYSHKQHQSVEVDFRTHMTDAYQESVQRLTKENNELKNSLKHFQVNLREMLELRRGINTKQYNDETLNNRDEKILN